jgi:hypothetical protein
MKLLLDTHAFLGWDAAPARLSAAARQACLDPANELLLSAASVWEVQINQETAVQTTDFTDLHGCEGVAPISARTLRVNSPASPEFV